MLKKYPFYIKCTVILFGLVLLVFILYSLKEILVPFSFGLILAVILNPLVNKFRQWKIPRVLAISLSLLLAIVLLGVIGYLISTQIAGFSDELPTFKKKSIELLHKLQHEISQRFNLNLKKQDELISQAETGMKPLVGQTLGTLAGSLEL